MTREEAIQMLKEMKSEECYKALIDLCDMAIKSLEQTEPSEKQVTSKLESVEISTISATESTMSQQKSKLDHDREWIIGCIKHDGFIKTDRFDKANQIILEALQNEQRWIPFKKRPMTDEEREEYPDWAYIFDCPLPEDEEEILLTNGVHVWTDTFINDGECYLDGGDDIDDDMAWMPMPKPYIERREP